MLGFSLEHIIIFVVVLLFFGPRHLPRLGAVLGKTARNFKEYYDGIQEPTYKKIAETRIIDGNLNENETKKNG